MRLVRMSRIDCMDEPWRLYWDLYLRLSFSVGIVLNALFGNNPALFSRISIFSDALRHQALIPEIHMVAERRRMSNG